MMDEKTLSDLHIGQRGCVTGIGFTGCQRRRMLDLGLVSGTPVTALHKSPAGDPVAYLFRGSVIALRQTDAQKIKIQID